MCVVVGGQKGTKTYEENLCPRQKQQVDRLIEWNACRSRRRRVLADVGGANYKA